MDILLSIRWEWTWKIEWNKYNGTYRAYGIFLGPLCIVVTDMKFMETINKLYEKLRKQS